MLIVILIDLKPISEPLGVVPPERKISSRYVGGLYKHINMLGHYSFALADFVRRGVLRPINADELEIGMSLA